MFRGYFNIIISIAVKVADDALNRANYNSDRRPLRAFLLLGGLFLALPLWAASLSEQRVLFRQSDSALKSGNRSIFLASEDKLREYPLYPYLLYQDLTQQLVNRPAARVRAFLKNYPDLPQASQLRDEWLRQLARMGRWSELLSDYGPAKGVDLECLRRQALLYTQQTDQALQDMRSVWLHGYSRPTSCDPVFAAWRERGGLTPELIWQRFLLSMETGQIRLARYLRGMLQATRQGFADLWLAVHAKPDLVLDQNKFTVLDQNTAPIVIHGLKRWSRRNSVAAAAAYDLLQARLPPSEERDELQRRLAVFVASRGEASAEQRLRDLASELVDETVAEWRLRTALRQADWPMVLQWADAMPTALQEQLPWRYWRARALERIGQPTAAASLYRELATQRDYYGFLAADKAGLSYSFEYVPTPRDEAIVAQLKSRPAILRIREFLTLERYPDARTEWNALIKDASQEELRAAARVAHDWDWHDRVIVTLAKANDWNDIELRFPTPYWTLVERYAKAQRLAPAWVYAIMRKESIFQYDIRSSAGAIGLMQVMPATGQAIAKQLQVPWSGSYTLLDVDTNIRFGSYYLRAGLGRFGNSPMLATAAYNAGPGRVRSWLPETQIPADVWVELIPFSETRDYVKRVLEYAIVYQHRLGHGTELRMRNLMRL